MRRDVLDGAVRKRLTVRDQFVGLLLEQVEMVDGWAKVASRLGYYNYMYNLADATLPMFKYTPCRVEFPELAAAG